MANTIKDRNGEASESQCVLGIAGSLRAGSFNRKLLAAARELSPPGLAIEVFDIADIPLYNGDLDTDERRPESVRRLKEAIDEADGVLFATPEYNHGVPGVLQNAIDWASRPAMRSPLAGKPVAIVGAATGAVGTARAQQQLKLVLLSTMALLMPHAGILVNHARDKFDEQGRLTDQQTRQFIATFLRDYETWIRRVGVPTVEPV